MPEKVTTQPSNGVAGLISMLVTALGFVQAAYPDKFPIVTHALHALPVVGQVLPIAIAILGMIYGAGSSAVPWLRKIMWWKKTRVTVVPSETGNI